MPKRVKNWRPDIYDLSAERLPPPAEDGEVVVVAEEAEEPAPGTSTDLTAGPAPPARLLVPVPAPRRRGDNEALLGLVAGAVVGAALTLLVAPASGAQLRARLQAQLEARAQEATKQAQALAQKMPNSSARGPDTPAAGEQNRQ